MGLAAVLEYVAERSSESPIHTFTDALWWSAATITTVGYGDMYPSTFAGHGVGLGLMLVGVSLFSLLTARVLAFFAATGDQESDARKLDVARHRNC